MTENKSVWPNSPTSILLNFWKQNCNHRNLGIILSVTEYNVTKHLRHPISSLWSPQSSTSSHKSSSDTHRSLRHLNWPDLQTTRFLIMVIILCIWYKFVWLEYTHWHTPLGVVTAQISGFSSDPSPQSLVPSQTLEPKMQICVLSHRNRGSTHSISATIHICLLFNHKHTLNL